MTNENQKNKLKFVGGDVASGDLNSKGIVGDITSEVIMTGDVT